MKCHLCDNWFEIHTNPKVRLPQHQANLKIRSQTVYTVLLNQLFFSILTCSRTLHTISPEEHGKRSRTLQQRTTRRSRLTPPKNLNDEPTTSFHDSSMLNRTLSRPNQEQQSSQGCSGSTIGSGATLTPCPRNCARNSERTKRPGPRKPLNAKLWRTVSDLRSASYQSRNRIVWAPNVSSLRMQKRQRWSGS